jgi:hypothetical protein
MKYQNANIAMLAILSIAALVGGFTVQAAEAQNVFQGVRVGPLAADESGAQFNTRELALSAGERGILIIPSPER